VCGRNLFRYDNHVRVYIRYVGIRWGCQDWVHWGLAQVPTYGAPLGLPTPKSSLAPAYDEVSGGLPGAVA